MLKILIATTFRLAAKNNLHIFTNVAAAFSAVCSDSECHAVDAADAVQIVSDWRPDLVVLFGPSVREDIDYRLIAECAKRIGSTSAFWLTDDPYEFDARHRFVQNFDHIFSNDAGTVPYYFKDHKVSHLPLAAGFATDYRDVVFEKTFELLFCGYPYLNRRYVVEDILNYAPSVSLRVAGAGWDDLGFPAILGGNDHAELIDLYSQSLFVLNLGRTYNIANKYNSIVATTPGPRTFEAALAGVPQIYVSPPQELWNYFESDEIIAIDDVRNIHNVLDRYRQDPSWWTAMARKTQRRVLSEHLYEHRVEKLLVTLQNRSLIPTFELNTSSPQVGNGILDQKHDRQLNFQRW